MPMVLRRSHLAFHVHDRHPLLKGLPLVVLCLAFIIAFMASVMAETRAPLSSGEVERPSSGASG